MVGNDIVDIIEAHKASNWQRPRFLSKIFTDKEQVYVLSSNNAFEMIWRLWTMKEAAYKVYTQIHNTRFYNPKGFECTINGLKGEVNYKDFKCFLETELNSNYILSEARLSPGNFSSNIIELKGNDDIERSVHLKTILLSRLNQNTTDSNKIELEYNDLGIPSVTINNTTKAISLTHHGRYGAFAMS